jgi:hypothetical protein
MCCGLEKPTDGQVIFSESISTSQKYVYKGTGQRKLLNEAYDHKVCLQVRC